jgi:zinc-ribbon domain
MVCQACGSEVSTTEVRFCPRCGAPVALPAQPVPPPQYASYPPYPQYPPMVAVPRVQRNLQTLGVLWCIYAVYRFGSAIVSYFVLRTFAWRSFGFGWPMGRWGGPWGPNWVGGLLPIIAGIALIAIALALTTAYGLMTRKPWGRVLAIIAAILALLKIPFGTALGIYTLWVLAPAASGMEYDAIADQS